MVMFHGQMYMYMYMLQVQRSTCMLLVASMITTSTYSSFFHFRNGDLADWLLWDDMAVVMAMLFEVEELI